MEITSSEKNSRSYIVFFDLDRTVTDSVSGRELATGAYKRGLMKRSDLAGALLLSLFHKMRLADPARAIARMGKWVKGIPVEKMEKLSSDICNEILIPSVYTQVHKELSMHKGRNALVVILSSTIAPVCRIMAGHLGIDDVQCTDLEEKDGVLTGNPSGNFCFEEEKAVRLKEYCEKNNSKLQDAWYYGDSVADIPALSIVGHPVCINPEKKLEKLARKNNWKIYYWHKEN